MPFFQFSHCAPCRVQLFLPKKLYQNLSKSKIFVSFLFQFIFKFCVWFSIFCKLLVKVFFLLQILTNFIKYLQETGGKNNADFSRIWENDSVRTSMDEVFWSWKGLPVPCQWKNWILQLPTMKPLLQGKAELNSPFLSVSIQFTWISTCIIL